MKSKESFVTKRKWVKDQDVKRIQCAQGRKYEHIMQHLEQAKINGDKVRVKMFQDMLNCLTEKGKKN